MKLCRSLKTFFQTLSFLSLLFLLKTAEKQESWAHANTNKKQYCLECHGLQTSKSLLHCYIWPQVFYLIVCLQTPQFPIMYIVKSYLCCKQHHHPWSKFFINCDVLWFWHHCTSSHLTLHICAVARIHYSISTNEKRDLYIIAWRKNGVKMSCICLTNTNSKLTVTAILQCKTDPDSLKKRLCCYYIEELSWISAAGSSVLWDSLMSISVVLAKTSIIISDE